MQWRDNEKRTAARFARLYDRHGYAPQSLDWSGAESQQARFQVFSGIGDLAGATVLDVGCGFGDYLGWLGRQGLEVTYTGLDIAAPMVEEARQRHPDAEILRGSLLDGNMFAPESFDYVFASGIFYLQETNPYGYMKALVDRMFSVCRKGLAFNSLSSWGTPSGDGEFRADPCRVLELCRKMSVRAVLRHDYHPGDFTVFLYKGEAS